MTLEQAITALQPLVGDALVVHANGYISRRSFTTEDRPGNFYMIGSMGLASSIALGVALSRPERRVVVYDGDGNLLMNLGSLAMIASTAAVPEPVKTTVDRSAPPPARSVIWSRTSRITAKNSGSRWQRSGVTSAWRTVGVVQAGPGLSRMSGSSSASITPLPGSPRRSGPGSPPACASPAPP